MDTSEFAAGPEAEVWVEDLEPEVCWRLLARRPVGRVGFNVDAIPVVLPVNHHVDGTSIVFRTGRSSLLETLCHGARVCFELDEVDALVETGWSVLVKGRAAEVTDPVELDDVTRLPLHPWAPGPKDHWIRIDAREVTGRSISRKRHDTDGRLIPYMPPD
jgi:nitroimidazol reductase NimA-like FMN-containing flavoprotein (pyridoxamine 5'-phosphate oxidase superfamily)